MSSKESLFVGAALLEEGKRVLRLERQALQVLEEQLSQDFPKAVECLGRCQGKLIFSGMGKAGIIAQKLAATFSSLGKPAIFMHPGEASHGDLGIIASDDCVIFLSNSGESDEVIVILDAIKRLGATIMAITGSRQSALARASHIVLCIGKVEEACSLGLAPTTSTLLMLALGDALAVAYLKINEAFDEKAFAFYHPGGDLGKRYQLVEEKMRTGDEIVVVLQDEVVKDILVKMSSARSGCAIICDRESHIEGFFSDGDLRRALQNGGNILDQPISRWMSKKPITVNKKSFISKVIELMRGHKLGDVPVVNEHDLLVGVLSLKDIV